jgi:hypothetical protein
MRNIQTSNALSRPRDNGCGQPAMDLLSIAMVAMVAMLAISLSGLFGEALAQNRQSPPSGQSSDDPRYKAPIGARQPRPRDLPEGVLRDEGHVAPSQRDFDKSLQICRDC